MSGSTLLRPTIAGHDRLNLVADAFLYAGVLLLLGFGVQGVVQLIYPPGPPDTPVSPLVDLLGVAALGLGVVGGPLLAWRLHRGRVHGHDLVGALAGVVGGVAVAGLVFFALRALLRLTPRLFPPDEGPWELGIIAVVGVVALVAKPLVDAVTDLVGDRAHLLLDVLRLGALAVAAVAVAVSIAQGGEGAELGLWLAVFGGAAAAAVFGMDLLASRRTR